jgi:mRNA interferase YafQ
LNIFYTTQFKKDYKRIKRQNKNLDKLKDVIDMLVACRKLDPKYHDHQLAGRWSGHKDCHIEPDWVLIYMIKNDELHLERTGSHAELFNN